MADAHPQPQRAIEPFSIASLITMVRFFTGENNSTTVDEFFNSLDMAASLGQWTIEQTLTVFKSRLAGPALHFYEANTVVQNTPFPQLRAVFLNWFQDPSPALDPLHDFFQTSQRLGERAKAFVVRLKLNGQKACPSSLTPAAKAVRETVIRDSLLNVYINNLRDESGREHLLNYPPVDLNAAIEFSVRFENNHTNKKRIFNINDHLASDTSSYQVDPIPDEVKQNTSPFTPKAETKMIAMISKLEQTMKSLAVSQAAPPAHDANRSDYPSSRLARENSQPRRMISTPRFPREHISNAAVFCYRCGNQNHYANQCTAPQSESRIRLRCSYCQRSGHSQRECRLGLTGMRTTTTAQLAA
jgi:hypothetical protein